jgi:hypothetical protein
MQLPSPVCGLEGGALSGLPCVFTGILAGDHNGQQNAPYLTRGLPNLACSRTATAVLHGAAFPHQRNATIAIAHKMIWSMLPSSSLPTGALIHSCHPPLLPTKETGLSRWRGLSTSAGGAVRSRGAPKRGEETGLRLSAVVIWSHHITVSTVYFCWVWPSRPRAQRKPVPWVCRANPPRPRAVVVMSEIGLCQDPPRIDRTTPFLSGPWGFRSGACL